MQDPRFFSNPHACDAPLAPGKQVRFQVDTQHHAHGCVETIVVRLRRIMRALRAKTQGGAP